jgi:hypothetical protein
MNCGPSSAPEALPEHTGYGWEGFREGIDYPGRPDFAEHGWGERPAKKFLPYVHSTTGNATLIHKVDRVKIRWYQGRNSYMRRLEQPTVIAETVCGVSRFITNGRKSSKMCKIPDPAAVLCGRCHGELPTFSKRRKYRIKKRWAKDHLGCKGVVEVIEPYAPPPMTSEINFEVRRK